MEKFGKRQLTFQLKIKIIYLLCQIPILVSVFILLSTYQLPRFLFIIFSSYTLFGFIYWHYHAIPEAKIHPKIMRFVILPYFLWQLTSIFSTGPLLLILLAMILHNQLFYIHLLLIMIIFSIIVACYGYSRCYRIIFKKISLPIHLFHSEFVNYKIAHISDIHLGNVTTYNKLMNWVQKLNSLKPDVVCITGDFITFGDAFIEDLSLLIKEIQAPDGVICCLGNHDYFASSTQHLINHLKKSGVIVLLNDVHTVYRNYGTISFIGIDGIIDNIDLQTKCLVHTMKNAKGITPHVLLAHDPLIFPLAKKHNIPLTLSGHTHGGQIAYPFHPRKNLASKRYHYSAGLYQDGSSYIYIHSGWGIALLPFRLFTSPEFVIFEISR